jgi:hypothetical protein
VQKTLKKGESTIYLVQFEINKNFGITGFLDSGQRTKFKILENTAFRKLDLFPSSDEGEEDTYSPEVF